jgi:hypothetical protein
MLLMLVLACSEPPVPPEPPDAHMEPSPSSNR